MKILMLAAGPDVGNLISFVVKLLIVLLLVGLLYWIINRPSLPIPEALRSVLNVVLVVAAVIGIIVWFLLPLAQ